MSRRRINKGCIVSKAFGLPILERHDYRKGRDYWTERYVKQSVEFASKYFLKGTVLDVGCAYGFAVHLFNQKGFSSVGVDLHPVDGIFNVILLRMDFYRLSQTMVKKAFLDNVFINHTLEHADSPMRLIEQVNSILRVGGKVFVAVPHIDDEWSWDLRDSTTHYSGFNEKFLESLWRRFGFKTLDLKTVELKPKRKPRRREIWYVGQKTGKLPQVSFIEKALKVVKSK